MTLIWNQKIIKLWLKDYHSPATLFERDSSTGVFLWILRNFWDQFFYRTPMVTASVCNRDCH